MEIFTVKFWIAFQMVIDLVLVLLIVYFLRYFRTVIPKDASGEAVKRIIGMLEPLLKEADTTAKAFERQLKEKNRIIQQLNERLDSRIISLNLLLTRAETCQRIGGIPEIETHSDVYDQQKAIVDLFNSGHDVQTVAGKLALPKREVEMVFNLKRKFLKIEQDLPAPSK
jgi:hypothetical protein